MGKQETELLKKWMEVLDGPSLEWKELGTGLSGCSGYVYAAKGYYLIRYDNSSFQDWGLWRSKTNTRTQSNLLGRWPLAMDVETAKINAEAVISSFENNLV